MNRSQILALVVLLIGLWNTGCGADPSEQKAATGNSVVRSTSHKSSWEKSGVSFRANWTWVSPSSGSAQVGLTITPTTSGESLRIQVRLPPGVGLTTGDLARTVTPVANVPISLSFQVAYPAGTTPLIPADVLMAIADGNQSAATIPLRDPEAPIVHPSEKSGATTDVGGFPARVGGEMEPAKGKGDK